MKKATLFGLLLAMSLSLAGQESVLEAAARKGFSLSLGTSTGLLAGEGEEIVYRDSASKFKLSQLLWDIKPLFYAGADVHFGWHKPGNLAGFFVDTGAKFGFPSMTGTMEDRDWTRSSDGYTGFLTHYSVHDNKTNSAFLIDVNAGVSFRIKKILLKAYVAYNFMQFSWVGRGGSLLYPGTHYFLNNVDVITYKQGFHLISPAFSFYGEFNPCFGIELILKMTPLIVGIDDDHHLIRDPPLSISSDVFGGFFIEPALIFSYYPPVKFLTLSLAVSYRDVSETRGNAQYSSGITAPHGMGYHAFDVGIAAKFKLF